MRAKTLFAAAFMALLPVTGFAMCSGHTQETAATCMDGYTWDGESGTCVEITTG
ncbi:MAG: adenylosuccinate lyase [Maritimibacter harenae]|jgi:hypothetical protein|uniref:Adenylosuccinate lyase n=1 Tax=Maritimibacter harenae TaxID=2606218 RepID=A0A845M5Y7_9RHOB|nr:adenylosuccinate lyase [Maritimibacter harenae]MZR12893.1 adenylosuccinate lyase [Maritimibacter harenae]